MLHWTGQLCRLVSHQMKRDILNSLKEDQIARTKQVGQSIEAKFKEGDVHEAFRLLKGWYRAATKVKARPCYQMMNRQMEERIALYTRRTSPGEPLPINIALALISDGVPTQLGGTGRCGGADKRTQRRSIQDLRQSNAMAIRELEMLGTSSCD